MKKKDLLWVISRKHTVLVSQLVKVRPAKFQLFKIQSEAEKKTLLPPHLESQPSKIHYQLQSLVFRDGVQRLVSLPYSSPW